MHLTYHDSNPHTSVVSAAYAGEAGAPEEELCSRSADIDRLAKALRDTMEHADPIGEPEWGAMSETDRQFYRKCIKDILLHTETLRRLLD